MSSNSNAAVRMFEENLRDYSSDPTKPENENLYNGLANLAAAIGNIETKLDFIVGQLAELQRQSR